MAHTCPECGSQCYCNGDIDDLLLDNDEDVEACTCCFLNYEDDDDVDSWTPEEWEEYYENIKVNIKPEEEV